MTLTVLPAPKLNPGIDAFLKTWKAAKNTKDWSKGTSGCWYDGPLGGIELTGAEIPPELEIQFAERQRLDYIARGILDPFVLTPQYEAPYDSTQYNLYEPLHADITLLCELAERGFEWAGHYATRILYSYAVSAKNPWLRNGGEGEKPMLYSDRGRHRIAARVLQPLLKASRVYKAAGNVGMHAACLSLIDQHLDRIIANYPLRDEGQGDGLMVPHCRTFMTGHLLAVLRRLIFQGGTLGEKAMMAFDLYAQVVEAARRGPGTYVYDVAWNDEMKEFYEHPDEIPRNGIYTVNCWIIDMFREPRFAEWMQEFKDEAVATQYGTKHVIDSIAFFGEIVG